MTPRHYADAVPGRNLCAWLPVAASVAFVVGVAGCGGDPDAAPTLSTIAVTATDYVTIPARTTTSTIAAPQNDNGSQSSVEDDPTQERIHEIQAGDYLVGIAADYDVPVNYLPAYNGWDDGLRHSLVPGDEMRIPPSDWDPNGPESPVVSTDATTPDDSTTSDCAAGEQPETYTIQAGDIPANVARDHDVTVAELAAANRNTPNYGAFVVGIEINIPC